jgi:hypothetical protein
MMLESLDAMLVHTFEMRAASRTTLRLTWAIAALTFLIALGTVALVVDLFVR